MGFLQTNSGHVNLHAIWCLLLELLHFKHEKRWKILGSIAVTFWMIKVCAIVSKPLHMLLKQCLHFVATFLVYPLSLDVVLFT